MARRPSTLQSTKKKSRNKTGRPRSVGAALSLLVTPRKHLTSADCLVEASHRYDTTQYQVPPPKLCLDKYCTCILLSHLIVSRQSSRSALPSRIPATFRSYCFFSLPPYLFTSRLHQSPEPQVTKSPVVHPLSIQQVTKCFSSNSFVLITIHFDGGCTPWCTPPFALREFRTTVGFAGRANNLALRGSDPCAHALWRTQGQKDAASYRMVSWRWVGRRYSRTGARETGTRRE